MCRYLRYADAGDQFVGRTIALVGFLNSWMFAVLPPHFIEDVTPTILELFPICVLLPSMIPVCRLALASVVYHATRPRGGFDFPPTHELMKTALFSDRSKLAALSTKLNADMYRSEHMTATGIPPYVCLFMEIAGIPAKVKEMFVEVFARRTHFATSRRKRAHANCPVEAHQYRGTYFGTGAGTGIIGWPR